MSQIVTVTDADGVQHWTAAGSAAHQRLTQHDTEEATGASDDAPSSDSVDAAAGDSGPGDGETDSGKPARRRRAGAAEPDTGGELQ